MWQFSALLFLLLPGCSTAQDPVTGPEEVRGYQQGSLTVQCRYASGWKDYRKYWCRGPERKTCEILVETDASERLVKENRVSIKDDQTNFIFTVTMEDLRMSDAGIYWCGIMKPGYDPLFKVRVGIEPGSSLWRSTNFPEPTISSRVYTQPSVTTEESFRITHFQPRGRKNLSLTSLSLHVLIKATSSLKGPESFRDLLPSSLREEDAEHLLASVKDFLGRGLSVHLLP